MGIYLGSANSRFCAGVRDGRLFLVRDEKLLWDRPFPFEAFQLIGLGTNGHLFILAPPGLFVYTPEDSNPAQPVPRWTREDLSASGAYLGGIRVSPDGRTLCLQRTTVQSRMSQKLMAVLSSKKAEPDTSVHEVLFHDLLTDQLQTYYRTTSPGRDPASFTWDISPDFEWILMAEPQRGEQLKFSLAHVGSQTIYQEFALPPVRLNGLRIDSRGTAAIDISQGDQRGVLLVTAEGHRNTVTVPTDFIFHHMGPDFIALETLPSRHLLIKTLDDQVRAFADLRPLERMGLDFKVHFNQHDAIDIIAFGEAEFKVLHSNLDYIEIDAKRWQGMADEMEAGSGLEEVVETAPRLRRLEIDVMARDDEKPLPPIPAPPPRDRMEMKPYQPPKFIAPEPEPEAARAPIPPPLPQPSSGRRPAPKMIDLPGAAPAPEPPAPTASPSLSDEGERKRVERLLELLEERFILGQVSEATYLELREKYHARLA